MEEGGRAKHATAVPNREGKVKSRWTVATVHEEALGERTVATEVTHQRQGLSEPHAIPSHNTHVLLS